MSSVLGFAEHGSARDDVPVSDEAGEVVAVISAGFWRERFVARDPAGDTLCQGKARLISGWSAQDAAGAPLMTVQVTRRDLRAVYRDGALSALLEGHTYGTDWRVVLDDGSVLLDNVRRRPGSGFPQRSWLVRSNGALELPEVLATVELHHLQLVRQHRRRRRNRRPKLPGQGQTWGGKPI